MSFLKHPDVMGMHRVRDLAPGTIFVCRDVIDGEIRNTFYVRDPDGDTRYAGNVRIARFGFLQADRYGKIRVRRFREVPCRDPGEMPGLTPCYLDHDPVFGGTIAEILGG